MKSTTAFKTTIENYLNELALTDPEFSAKYSNEKKNIDDCIKYILNTVQKSGCNGFEDDEIYGMALHYYDEEEIDVGKDISAKVVVNHVTDSEAYRVFKINTAESQYLNKSLKEEPKEEMKENWRKDIEQIKNNPKNYWKGLDAVKDDKERFEEIRFMNTYYTRKSAERNRPIKKATPTPVKKSEGQLNLFSI